MKRVNRGRHRTAALAGSLTLLLGAALTTNAFAAHGKSGKGGGGTTTTTAVSFTAPVELPGSGGLGEPSIATDSIGRLFVTAPQAIGNITGGGSPVWNSKDAGATWSNPPTVPSGDPLSGGDTDFAVDSADNVYQTDLWLGNSAMAVSTDHGASFIANEYGHTQPGDDRPWLAYSKKDNALYMVWDGVDAVHVQKSAPLVTPQTGILPGQDVPVVAESIISTGATQVPDQVRECVCPPGGITVDQNSNSIYVTYSRQNGNGAGGGVGVARSDDSGLTWTLMSIPGTGSTGSAFDTEYNFDPVKVDNNGTVYVMWAEGRKIVTDGNGNDVATGGVAIKYAYSKDKGATWSTPVTLSTTSNTATFPTMDVVSPGVIDTAWYGTSATGDPNQASNATWNLVFAQVTAADTPAPKFTPSNAATNIHTGCIQSGGSDTADCSDRSLLDFFQLVVYAGKANIIYAVGDATKGTNLWFVRQQ
jgi:hypothetical protein